MGDSKKHPSYHDSRQYIYPNIFSWKYQNVLPTCSQSSTIATPFGILRSFLEPLFHFSTIKTQRRTGLKTFRRPCHKSTLNSAKHSQHFNATYRNIFYRNLLQHVGWRFEIANRTRTHALAQHFCRKVANEYNIMQHPNMLQKFDHFQT